DSDRLAVAVESNPAATGGKSAVALEWPLEPFPPLAEPKTYKGERYAPPPSTLEETTFATYGPAGDNQLLFVPRGREDRPPETWLFNTRAEPPPPGRRVATTHRQPILQAVFSPQGNRLATAGADAKANLWMIHVDTKRSPSMSRPRELDHEARVFFTD